MFSIREKAGEVEVERQVNGAELLAFLCFLSLILLPWVLLFNPMERPSWIVTGAIAIWLLIGSGSGMMAMTKPLVKQGGSNARQ